MREDPLLRWVDRWDWYGRGDESLRRATRGSQSGGEDNSPEQVLWECGLVLAVPLSAAAVIQVASRLLGS